MLSKERVYNNMKDKKQSKIKLRTAFLSLMVITLLAATAAFLGTSAAEAVSGSDIVASGSDLKKVPSFSVLNRVAALKNTAPRRRKRRPSPRRPR